ncbi:MAG TPA: DNA polymerase III subunit epsilon [Acidocella sp.]|nr:DNA polymerase III subunit epsilon [Acidocella sp.]
MSRSVLFDTETTGFEPLTGDRVIEIAAIELENDLPTGNQFYALLDPERDIPAESTKVHAITSAHVEGKPKFAEVADDMLAFFADSPLIAHNAPFDFGFISAELERIGRKPLDKARMVDTLVLAKQRFPGMPNSLDALCRRFDVDLSARTTHNALLDCKLLAEVYVELTGGRQRGLTLESEAVLSFAQYDAPASRTPRRIVLTDAQREAHAAFISKIKEPVWLKE